MFTNNSNCHWFVYVLRNPDGKLYIGQTDNLRQHNDAIALGRQLGQTDLPNRPSRSANSEVQVA